MLRPTNDPIAVYRRAQEAAARDTREATAANGTQPFQAVDKLRQQVEDIRELVVRLPNVESASKVEHGFGLADVATGAWKTVATVSLPSPSGKNRAVVQASAQATVLDTRTQGLTSSSCRILINGVASAVIPAAKDAGASVVQNVLVVSDVREITPLPSSIVVQFQISPMNPAAFETYASNIANLTVYAGYSVI